MRTRRIFISLPADEHLTKNENDTKWAIVGAIERRGYTAEIFLDPRRNKRSLAAPWAWSAAACEEVMRRCDGCAVLGFPRWRMGDGRLPTEFNHYEGGVAYTLGLPLLVLVQRGLLHRVVFDPSYRGHVGKIPERPTPAWLRDDEFQLPFGRWQDELEERRDIFLGYCGASRSTAEKIKTYLSTKLGMSVLDWAADFDPAGLVLERIQQAAKRCRAGIFLFTKDDKLASVRGDRGSAAPRDNVVFEAGYFCSVKGKSRTLIVLERGAKMPADLGGDIYADLVSRTDITSVKETLRRFAAAI